MSEPGLQASSPAAQPFDLSRCEVLVCAQLDVPAGPGRGHARLGGKAARSGRAGAGPGLGDRLRLESLYLEEETLSVAAFDFAAGLPHLARIGLQDVPITEVELAALRRRLPGVAID